MYQEIDRLRRRLRLEPNNNLLRQKIQRLEEKQNIKERYKLFCPNLKKKDFEHCKIEVYEKDKHKSTIYLGFLRYFRDEISATPLNYNRYYNRLEYEEKNKHSILFNEEKREFYCRRIKDLIPSDSWSPKNPPDGINRSSPRFIDYISSFSCKKQRCFFFGKESAIKYLFKCYCDWYVQKEKTSFPETIVIDKDFDPRNYDFSSIIIKE